MIRHPAEGERDRNLGEETDCSHGVADQCPISQSRDDRGRVGIKGTLGAVVAESDEEVTPDAPVGEL